MAHTKAGRAATERHRAAQNVVSASIVENIRRLFLANFQPFDIDAGSREFLRASLPSILDARVRSHDLARDYLDEFRGAELTGLVTRPALRGDPRDPLTLPPRILREWAADNTPTPDALDDLPDVAELARALHSSGAGVAKRRIKAGESPETAKVRAANAVAAKAQKLVADGGRAPLRQEVSQRRRGAVGYARVVDADPCPFCAMLASRGAVYRSDAFADSTSLFAGDGRFKVHDGCGCMLEPVYGRRAKDLPPGSDELARQWAEVASGQPDPFTAWSRWIVSGTKPGEERANARTRTRGSAPQYGRTRSKASGKQSRRKTFDEMTREELERTLAGMRARQRGMARQLADLEARGQRPGEPGPATHLHTRLAKLETQIATAQAKLGSMSH